MQASEDRPPYVTFETKSVETRTPEGASAFKDVHYAYITPMGSKDRIERVVDEWFPHLQTQVDQQRFRLEWLVAYKGAYEAWKAGEETPLSGTPIRTWPAVTPAQAATLIALQVLTVEDLAVLNEEGIKRLGMGGRSLKEKASNWLASSKDLGKVVERLDALARANEGLVGRNAQLESQVQTLTAQLAAVGQPA